MPIKNINIGTLRHNLMLADCGIALARKFQGEFEPERRITDRYRLDKGEIKSHLPDGILHISGSKPVAIELELSAKNIARTKDIFLNHAADQKIGEVWVIVIASDIKRHIIRCSEGFENVLVRTWKPPRTYLGSRQV